MELAAQQDRARVARGGQGRGFAGGLPGVEVGLAHAGGRRGLDPDHVGPDPTLAFALGQIGAVAPDVAPLDRDLAVEEGDRAVEGVAHHGGVGFGRGKRGRQHQQQDGPGHHLRTSRAPG